MDFLKINRWIYDPSRGIPIDTRNPQKTYPVERKRLSDEEIRKLEEARERKSTANSSTHSTTRAFSQRPTRMATSVRLQEKMISKNSSTPKYDSVSENESEEEDAKNAGVTDAALFEVYKKYKNTARSGTTPWTTIVSALDNKVTVHRLKSRVKSILEAKPPKTTTTTAVRGATARKTRRAAVVDVEDDDDDGNVCDLNQNKKLKQLEAKLDKLSGQSESEILQHKKLNKALKEDNAKLLQGLTKGVYNNFVVCNYLL